MIPPALKTSVLLNGMQENEIEKMFSSLHAEERQYKKNTTILHSGTVTKRIGFVLEGSVTISKNYVGGNRTILSHVGIGQFFAETYAFFSDEPLLIDVIANEDCRICFLEIGNLREFCNPPTSWSTKLLYNLLTITSRKNLLLSERITHTASKTIRERVMSYLSVLAIRNQSTSFDIPFDRQQLADYLNVERSALSKELGKMQRDGMIRTQKKHFVILKESEFQEK